MRASKADPARAELGALMAQRAELDSQHETACRMLDEQGLENAPLNYRRCVKIYDEREAVQRLIDAHLAAARSK